MAMGECRLNAERDKYPKKTEEEKKNMKASIDLTQIPKEK